MNNTTPLLSNCIGYLPAADKGTCIVCDIGYRLTLDGFCEEYTLP
jgi:hypothetical protein